MQYFHRLAQKINVAPLANALARQSRLWNRHSLRTTFEASPHREADDIWLRFNDLTQYADGALLGLADDCEAIWYEGIYQLPQARDLIFELMAAVQGERLGRVMITRLKPGAKIYPHEDMGAPALYYDRHHIVINNAPGSIFRIGDEVVTMKPGEVWWINNTIEHEVVNNSSEDRIVMIVDIRIERAQPWSEGEDE